MCWMFFVGMFGGLYVRGRHQRQAAPWHERLAELACFQVSNIESSTSGHERNTNLDTQPADGFYYRLRYHWLSALPAPASQPSPHETKHGIIRAIENG
jgi:hypothetical protein